MSGRRASKRRQAGEGPSAPSFDNRRFVSQAAEDHHNTNVLKRRFVKERGLAGHEEIMHQRHWEAFMAKPEAGNKTLVREFYANVKFNSLDDRRALVRGATITFSSSAINHLLGAPIVDEPNDFKAFIQHPLSWETISKVICATPPDWVLNVYNEPVGILHSSLTNEAWDWLRFINARLYPSSYLSEVSKERAVLLYAILTGVPLDIGRYINGAIFKSARGGKTVSLFFPSLITALCHREGLENLPGDELIQPNTTINEENRAPPPPPPPAHRRQRRPRELGLDDRLTHVEEGLHNLQLQHQRHMVEHQRLRLEQRQCFAVLYDHFQIPPDRRPQFAPDEPDAPDNAA
ncbi:hypothetical protein CDL12_09769 [Handroanthus impetiginosus]|uniref:Putative plant transposon protein domain-containing protein n=1 Tax=Handroanthus impetiginosus TaxID=429701 RepID=A0A2G9HJ82_9LAMI|nr:hypothetical protein CDL12_09769 [Handroanthus impetiginosus]